MKVARFSSIDGVAHGVVEGDSVKVLRGGLFDEFEYTGKEYPLADVQLLAPVEPGKLVCVGLNYRLHAEESGVPVPDEPMLFMCSPQAIVAQGDTIVLDNHSDRIDFEAEIAIVVGREGRNVRRNEAKDYIFGYTCANDVSNRDLQRKDGQFTRAKSFDTYKPLGPWIETSLDPDNVAIQLWQNGELRQSSNTNDMIFPIARIVEFVSGIMTLKPGDVIITGTPSGVGPMKKGDTIELEIEGIGRLVNKVV
ncbi:fumarylacetoacetate hydrolase family protein [Pusillimonas sp. MFBS29]|uniref:fumarylacetoacetate hydrolase family protein n=1 Tax=Pusillimonas sp. MFBS29 TaxID=2886690 RepID=UPI001D11CDCE|nr:fumarylacetoacetate hydrolase family protein [Pusillimonas sp. MFBS29]MCC2596759.1 fumarylacetoacetate hydrolase family protein [Pusillimonas sp. MFBS29]